MPPVEVPAYGLTLRIGVEDPPTDDSLDLRLAAIDGPIPENVFTDDHHVQRLLLGGWIEVDRVERACTIHTDAELGTEELLHPYAGVPAGAFAHWRGDLTFHASTVVIEGSAWAFVGPREAGKSTMIALALDAGLPVLTDDLLILQRDGDGLVGRRGPGFADLREGAARELEGRYEMTKVRDGERWRVRTGPVDDRVPFGGFVILEEHPDFGIERVQPSDRPLTLGDHRYVRIGDVDPVAWLHAATRPMVRLRRPKTWRHIDEILAHLHGLANEVAGA